MHLFSYEGRDNQGKLVKGTVEALSKEQAASYLLIQKIIPIKIKQSHASWWQWFLLKQPIKKEELASLARQMYTLYRSGVPLSTCTLRVAQSMAHPALVKALKAISKELEAGKTLSASLETHGKLFPGLFCSLVRIGEETGRLDQSLLQLSEYFELEEKTLKQFQGVLRYPVITIVATLIAFLTITTSVIPTFAAMYEEYQTELPWMTQCLMQFSKTFRENWFLVMFGFLCVWIVGFFHMKTPSACYQWGYYQLRIPILGKLLTHMLFARFARTFSMIIQTGLPLHEGFELIAKTTKNVYLSKKLSKLGDDLSQGEPLSLAAQKSTIFPILVLQMFATGEETGMLDSTANQIAEFYEREVTFGLKRFKDLLQPLLLAFLGLMVTLLALGTLVPIWSMARIAQSAG